MFFIQSEEIIFALFLFSTVLIFFAPKIRNIKKHLILLINQIIIDLKSIIYKENDL